MVLIMMSYKKARISTFAVITLYLLCTSCKAAWPPIELSFYNQRITFLHLTSSNKSNGSMKKPVTSWLTLCQAATSWLSSLPAYWSTTYAVDLMAIILTWSQCLLPLCLQSSNCSWAGRLELFLLSTTIKSSKTLQTYKLRLLLPKIATISSSWTVQTGTCVLHARFFRSAYITF
jgi:hypothetical protein